MKKSGKKRFLMSFKQAFSALAVSALAAFSIGLQCFAETSEPAQEENSDFSSDLSFVERSYDGDMSMFLYTFPDGAQFYSTEKFTEEENLSSGVFFGSEEEDISISVNSGEGLLEQSSEYFITDEGTYEVTVSHTLRNESGTPVEARFAVTVGTIVEETQMETISGRVELESVDGTDFRHKFLNGSELVTNVLDGETVSFYPKLSIPEDAFCTMTRDGSNATIPSSGLITDDGSYNIEITCYDNDGNIEKRYISFSLFKNPTNRLGIYQPPYGYELKSLTLNGESIPFADKNYVVLDGEGDYLIEYTNGSVSRSVTLSRDTLPPVLYFNDTTDIVFGENVFVTADCVCTLSVMKNGQAAGDSPELLGAGIYRVTATDAAGNVTSARVEIKAISAINPLDIIIVIVALVVAAVVYYLVQRNRTIRVR